MTKKILFTGFILLLMSMTAAAAVPGLINYQGQLSDAGGSPVADGWYNITFEIWNHDITGIALWTEIRTTFITDGAVNIALGEINPIDVSVFSTDARYLAITIGTDPTITPRFRLVSSPYAFRTASVDGAEGGNIVSKLSIGTGHTNIGQAVFTVGENNSTTGKFGSITGGSSNIASGWWSHVGGGENCVGHGNHSTISGGEDNLTEGTTIYPTIAGGFGNQIRGNSSTISGGLNNTIMTGASNSVIGGGQSNIIDNILATIAGGDNNLATGQGATIGGGAFDSASGMQSTIGGGTKNATTEWASTVGGGNRNRATGQFSTIPGGFDNKAGGLESIAMGGSANAANDNCFVFSDGMPFASTGVQQFLIRASGGVGINTNAPSEALHVLGNICYTGTIGACSDRRYKKEITNLSNSLSKVLQLRGVTYKWNHETYPGEKTDKRTHLGFIAQEVEELYPAMVMTDDKGFKSVDYGRLTPVLVEAVKEQQSEIESLTQRLAKLEQAMSILTSTTGDPKYGMK